MKTDFVCTINIALANTTIICTDFHVGITFTYLINFTWPSICQRQFEEATQYLRRFAVFPQRFETDAGSIFESDVRILSLWTFKDFASRKPDIIWNFLHQSLYPLLKISRLTGEKLVALMHKCIMHKIITSQKYYFYLAHTLNFITRHMACQQ